MARLEFVSDVTIRAVRDARELAAAFDAAGAVQDPPVDHTDWRFDAVRQAFPGDADVDQVAVCDNRLVGAALSFRDEGGVRVRLLGVEGTRQGEGVGRRLLDAVEEAAWTAGDTRVYLGGVPHAANFYRRCGYSRVPVEAVGVTVFEKTPTSRHRLGVVADAPWLPAGSDAETYRWDAAEPPEPVCLVRVMPRRGDEFFLVDTEKGWDLPTRFVARQPEGGQWRAALAALQGELGIVGEATCFGFVRNVVPAGADYPFPTPHAHFAVFEVTGVPAAAGRWFSLSEARPACEERHWWPVVADRIGDLA